jgi:hypothetical protein
LKNSSLVLTSRALAAENVKDDTPPAEDEEGDTGEYCGS